MPSGVFGSGFLLRLKARVCRLVPPVSKICAIMMLFGYELPEKMEVLGKSVFDETIRGVDILFVAGVFVCFGGSGVRGREDVVSG